MNRIIQGFFLFILFFLLSSHTTFAQEWIIEDYSSDIAIQENGEVFVEETIEVDFGTTEKHGIYRDIPYVYKGDGESVYTQVDVESIFQDGESAQYEVIQNDNYVRFKIGDPDETISGEHTYQIAYTVRGVLRGFEIHDELYWNVVGPYWEVPMENVSAVVSLPEDGRIQVDCFVGEAGSTENCISEMISSSSATFTSTRSLNPYEAFTIVVGYEKGLVPLLTVERPKSFFEKFIELPSLFTLLSVLVFGIGTVFTLWYRYGRDYWHRQKWNVPDGQKGEIKPVGAHETIVVEYEPPENLRPAELGVLFDERAHTHDVTATIIDLAIRGYLTITEIPKKWMFGKTDYKLTRKKDDYSTLEPYESLLLEHLFGKKKDVQLSDLKRTFYEELKEVKSKLYDAVVTKKFFPTNPEKVRERYLIAGFIVLIACFGAVVLGLVEEQVFLFNIGVGGVVSGMLLLMLSQFMPRKTAKGRELYRRIQGYKLFISTVEKHRQKFFEKKNMFNEVLPYAIVFELTDKYINATADMGIKPQTTSWYHGTRPFVMGHFAASMSDFSSSVSQSIASAPKSSGFSSGGGYSGGGFGGGGGGSW